MFGAAAGPGRVWEDGNSTTSNFLGLARAYAGRPARRSGRGLITSAGDYGGPLALQARLEQDERRRRDVVRVRLDPDLGVGRLFAQAGAELVRPLLGQDVDGHVFPAPVHGQALVAELVLELGCRI